jgi:hypothetical protein
MGRAEAHPGADLAGRVRQHLLQPGPAIPIPRARVGSVMTDADGYVELLVVVGHFAGDRIKLVVG